MYRNPEEESAAAAGHIANPGKGFSSEWAQLPRAIWTQPRLAHELRARRQRDLGRATVCRTRPPLSSLPHDPIDIFSETCAAGGARVKNGFVHQG